MQKPTALFVSDRKVSLAHVSAGLRTLGWQLIRSGDRHQLTDALQTQQPRLAFVEHPDDPASNGLDLARWLRCRAPHLPLVLLSQQSSEALLLTALRAGFCDYLKWPFSQDELHATIQHCLATATPAGVPPQPTEATPNLQLIGDSAPMRAVQDYLTRVARTDSNVLITGETGTGKELMAILLHQYSLRHPQPLVCINCAAIPDSLLESELFGHERGAFTGAVNAKAGLLKQADHGTVFFDEIGDMSPYAQAKILRAIEGKELQRLGSTHHTPVDVRIVAATNQSLEQMVEQRTFRADLYFRLNVARIHLPPLRERQEDLHSLCQYYIDVYNQRFHQNVEGCSDEVMACFLRYNWPGNVRELKNLFETIFISLAPTRHQWITLADLPEYFRQQWAERTEQPGDERHRLLEALFATNWNKSQAAQKLRWSRMTVYRKMAKYNITPSNSLPRRPAAL